MVVFDFKMNIPQNPHRCRLVKNFPNSGDWGHWRLWYYLEPLPAKSKRCHIDIPGEWNSTNGWRYSEYVRMAIDQNHSLDAILSAARGNYILGNSKKKKR